MLRGTNAFRSDMDQILSDFFQTGLSEVRRTFNEAQSQIPINVSETGDAYILEAELPGVSEDELELIVEGKEITLKVNPKKTETSAENKFYRKERFAGARSRVLRLPVQLDTEKVEANLKDGVLTVQLAKAETAKAKKIQVTAH